MDRPDASGARPALQAERERLRVEPAATVEGPGRMTDGSCINGRRAAPRGRL